MVIGRRAAPFSINATRAFVSYNSECVIDRGRLLLTTKALVFEGTTRNERITMGRLSGVKLYSDGFSFSRRSGAPITFTTAAPDARFAAASGLLIGLIS